MAYRLILGREPESAEVVEEYRSRLQSLKALRECFLESTEFREYFLEFTNFRSRTPLPVQTGADYGLPLTVDTDLEPSALRQLFERVEQCWRACGNTDPYWSVVSLDQFRSTTFSEHSAEFHDSGRRDAERLLAWLVRSHIDPASIHTCCEYGCGVGRVTSWLSSYFARVFAYDISEPHLDIARQHLLKEGHSNVTLHKVDTISSLSTLERVDLVFSIIVLQHNPPPVIAHVVRMLLRSLNTKGLAYFQVPTYGLGYRFDAEQYLRNSLSTSTFEMHVLPQSSIFRIARDEGCVVLEVQPDSYVGDPQWVSNTFLVQRI